MCRRIIDNSGLCSHPRVLHLLRSYSGQVFSDILYVSVSHLNHNGVASRNVVVGAFGFGGIGVVAPHNICSPGSRHSRSDLRLRALGTH